SILIDDLMQGMAKPAVVADRLQMGQGPGRAFELGRIARIDDFAGVPLEVAQLGGAAIDVEVEDVDLRLLLQERLEPVGLWLRVSSIRSTMSGQPWRAYCSCGMGRMNHSTMKMR